MRISDWSSDVCSSDLYGILLQSSFANRLPLPQRGFGMPCSAASQPDTWLHLDGGQCCLKSSKLFALLSAMQASIVLRALALLLRSAPLLFPPALHRPTEASSSWRRSSPCSVYVGTVPRLGNCCCCCTQ